MTFTTLKNIQVTYVAPYDILSKARKLLPSAQRTHYSALVLLVNTLPFDPLTKIKEAKLWAPKF